MNDGPDTPSDQDEPPIPGADGYEFVASVAHELRSRLSPIPLQMELLRSEVRKGLPDAEVAAKLIGRLDLTVNLCLRRATRLLEATRVASSHITLRPTDIDITSLAGKIVQFYSPLSQMTQTTNEVDSPVRIIGRWDQDMI